MPPQISILYVVLGILLAIPYCLLAGWDDRNIGSVAFVAPAFFGIWFMFAGFAGIVRSHHGRLRFNWHAAFEGDYGRLPYSLPVFWGWTIYMFLPVILHWSGVLLEKVGYETLGSLINEHRYPSILYVFLATFMLLELDMMLMSAWETIKKYR